MTFACLLVAAVAIGLDQWTKVLAEVNLDPREPVRILGGLVYLSLTWNSGAAFSLGTGYTWIFTTVASLVVVFLVFLSTRIRYPMWSLALGLVLGGAAGNLIDRLFRSPSDASAPFTGDFGQGHVVDFISAFKPFGEAFAIFNLADAALCCGVVLIVLLELTGHGFSPESRKRPEKEPPEESEKEPSDRPEAQSSEGPEKEAAA
ncbi:signal peptidase II [Glycomyces sp. NRRL B-16210]|uniref:signal peptidase II n=1 Tax=Glycomyces sp. NRRL B-16210 TaxID=1463821 RepID=UPI000A921067|nr:signal peptidase II [Glycomyces sp. NRRL B-16210]